MRHYEVYVALGAFAQQSVRVASKMDAAELTRIANERPVGEWLGVKMVRPFRLNPFIWLGLNWRLW